MSAVYATSDGPDYWRVSGVAVNDVLNVRVKPNWKSEKIAEIPHNGVCITNLECIGGLSFPESVDLSDAEKNKILKRRPRWCRIKHKNSVGWVAGKFLHEGQEPECYQ